MRISCDTKNEQFLSMRTGMCFDLATAASIVGLIGGAKTVLGDKPKMPEIKAPTPMPTANDAAIDAAKRRKSLEIQARSGRASTILSDTGGQKLGG